MSAGDDILMNYQWSRCYSSVSQAPWRWSLTFSREGKERSKAAQRGMPQPRQPNIWAEVAGGLGTIYLFKSTIGNCPSCVSHWGGCFLPALPHNNHHKPPHVTREGQPRHRKNRGRQYDTTQWWWHDNDVGGDCIVPARSITKEGNQNFLITFNSWTM